MNVAEMRILRWMCGKTRNEYIRKTVGVTHIEDKLRKNRLKWYDHVQRKPIHAPVRKSDRIVVPEDVKGRCRPRLTWDLGTSSETE